MESFLQEFTKMSGQGSSGNVLAALASFIYPGLGQLVQGRPLKALIHFVLGTVLWVIFMGWIMHIWSALEASWYVAPQGPDNQRANHSFSHYE